MCVPNVTSNTFEIFQSGPNWLDGLTDTAVPRALPLAGLKIKWERDKGVHIFSSSWYASS